MKDTEQSGMSRRMFIQSAGVAGAALGMAGMAGRVMAADDLPGDANGNVIPGFGEDDKG